MKLKRSLTAMVLGLVAVVAVGQVGPQNLRIKEEGKTVFNPHWYMQGQAGASYTEGKTPSKNLISPAMGINVGYQFTPLWGLRAGLSGWESKGAWSNRRDVYKYKYLQGNIDATLDLSNLFCKYNPKRFFNAYMFMGIGLNGGFKNDEAIELNNAGKDFEYLWTDNKMNVAGRAGLGTNLRLSDHIFFNLEVNTNVLSDKYDSRKSGNPSWQFNTLAGFTFKFGKTHKTTPPVYYDPEPIQPAPEPVKEVEPAPAPAPAPVVEPITENIFFLIDSAKIRACEEHKITSLVDYLKAHTNAKVQLCGYADKKTGNAYINKRISEKRAKSVAKALIDNGIAEDRISIDFKGDTVQPFAVNKDNRVCICIAE